MRLALLLLFVATTASAATVNFEKKEIKSKIVYVSVTEGAYANLSFIYEKTNPGKKAPPPNGEAFDMLPLALGELRGFKTLFDLYGVRSAPQNTLTRQQLLKDVDGVIFVASAAPHAQRENTAAFERLKKDLAVHGADVASISLVLQLDTDGVQAPVTVEALRKTLGLPETTQGFSATPKTGQGVFDTLKAMAKLLLMKLKNQQPADAGR
jgi:mutual gliding-motility protein MglA